MARKLEFPLPVDEGAVWQSTVRPLLEAKKASPASVNLGHYVITEVLNNASDHSGGKVVRVGATFSPKQVAVQIADDGVGIFRKLKEGLGLASLEDAVLALSKGKSTTDPANHTGEGLFFSSKACDWFAINANGFGVHFERDKAASFLRFKNPQPSGTNISLKFGLRHRRPLKEIFDEYCPLPDNEFNRTVVPVRLLEVAEGGLVSRSQGKRLTAGLEKFSAVAFDFRGVKEVQQGFADEVFRVWRASHPQIDVSVMHAAPGIYSMLRHVGFDRNGKIAKA